jgi:7-cyano-7-deazaguanine synthase
LKNDRLSFIISLEFQIMKKALVLFSGGLDSTTALYWAIEKHTHVCALTFDYGQRHAIEVRLAQKIAKTLNVPLKILNMDLQQIGGSSLTDLKIPLPTDDQTLPNRGEPPSTYVPFRNGIFLALAAAWAEVHGQTEIVCGFHVLDAPDYPDTRQEFVSTMEEAINLGSKASFGHTRIHIQAPFLDMKKSEIIIQGIALGADYAYSVSCYSGAEIPCLKCASCQLRQKAWEEVGVTDPLILRLQKEGKI